MIVLKVIRSCHGVLGASDVAAASSKYSNFDGLTRVKAKPALKDRLRNAKLSDTLQNWIIRIETSALSKNNIAAVRHDSA